MKLPGWLRAALVDVVLPVVREVVKAELESLRLKHGPASPVPPGTTGPNVLREEPRK